MPDLLEGRVGLAMLDGALAVAHAASGKLTIVGRADAVGTRDASRAPTLVEQGAAGLWVDTRLAMMAPMSMPTETMEPLRALLTTTLKKPSVRVQLEQGAFHPIDADPDRFARSVTESVEHYRRLVRRAGLL